MKTVYLIRQRTRVSVNEDVADFSDGKLLEVQLQFSEPTEILIRKPSLPMVAGESAVDCERVVLSGYGGLGGTNQWGFDRVREEVGEEGQGDESWFDCRVLVLRDWIPSRNTNHIWGRGHRIASTSARLTCRNADDSSWAVDSRHVSLEQGGTVNINKAGDLLRIRLGIEQRRVCLVPDELDFEFQR